MARGKGMMRGRLNKKKSLVFFLAFFGKATVELDRKEKCRYKRII